MKMGCYVRNRSQQAASNIKISFAHTSNTVLGLVTQSNLWTQQSSYVPTKFALGRNTIMNCLINQYLCTHSLKSNILLNVNTINNSTISDFHNVSFKTILHQ